MTATCQLKRIRPVAAALLLAVTLAGCSSVIENMPQSLGGLPEGTPPRPAATAAYPGVHDVPQARQETPLSEAESKRLREDLKNTRNRIEATGTTTAPAAGSARNP